MDSLIASLFVVMSCTIRYRTYHSSDGCARVGCEIISWKNRDFVLLEFPYMFYEQIRLETIGMVKIGLGSLFYRFVGLVLVIMVVCQINAIGFTS